MTKRLQSLMSKERNKSKPNSELGKFKSISLYSGIPGDSMQNSRYVYGHQRHVTLFYNLKQLRDKAFEKLTFLDITENQRLHFSSTHVCHLISASHK